uniref:3-beta hydroxysteroid dehydrogenase/isomerase domain-containing protein n=1 Tax=Populus trichocarpa TaxID=3694 RepID=A0A2K1R4D3_POPTR
MLNYHKTSQRIAAIPASTNSTAPLPQDFGNGEAEEVVIQGAADGTLGILKACLNSKTVKRVVYTSSASAVAFNDSGVEMMDGSYWSNVDYIRASNLSTGLYFKAV